MGSRNEAAINDAAKRIAAETYTETLAMAVDVRSADSLAAWHARTIEKFGGVDLLYVNAGGPPAGPDAVVRRRRSGRRRSSCSC